MERDTFIGVIVLLGILVLGILYVGYFSGEVSLSREFDEGPTVFGRKVCGNAGVGGWGVTGHGCKGDSDVGKYVCYSDGGSCRCEVGPSGRPRWRSFDCQAGKVCKAGHPGDGGGCQDCPDGEYGCRNICIDLDSDERNCGACGNQCGSGETCFSGGICNDCGTLFAILAGQEDPDCENCGDCTDYEGLERELCVDAKANCDDTHTCWE
jgi:hypothetical protein